ncbi:LOC109796742 isoform [Fagus crenata]
MKLSTKPISSPGRTEKFPPPLMRFLRSNVGSRSRGRSRSSPMFVRKKNATIETQEPSSPKVTCMGQVRVRRSSKQASKSTGRTRRSGAPTKRRCKWLRNVLFCHHIARKIKPKSCRPAWPKWVLFFQVGFRRKSEIRRDSSKAGQKFEKESQFSEQEEVEEEEDEKEVVAKVFVSNQCSPPKNALLLTRCRSAPYRSSSLASRFWGSPLKTETETEPETDTEQENREEEHAETIEKPTSESESISDQESRTAPETEGKLAFLKEFEGSITQRFLKSSNVEELKAVDSVHPLILTRCKSEPARTAEKLNPDTNFWKRRRLGLTDSRSPHVF